MNRGISRQSETDQFEFAADQPTPEARRIGWHSLFDPVDNASLVFFRIFFGAVMLWFVWGYYREGQIEKGFSQAPFHFTYHGFEWVKPWPGIGMRLHFYALGVFATGMMLGCCYRLSALLFCLGWTYVFLIDKAYFQNHHYLVCLISLIMIFVPAHRALSLDALIRPSIRDSVAPAWTLWLLRGQFGIPYFFGGISKINSDWLHGEPMRS